ncbi:MAG: peptidase dimerization domain-containing protein, partial [Alphaproteobacteria bacterium]|nr:peptidase dimerization domain-containing protein [Alphaproteobacteria bacterium]
MSESSALERIIGVGVVGLVTVNSLEGPLHSGEFGGAAPDALAALIAMLATLHDADGNTTIGLDNTGVWSGQPYPEDQFRADARVLEGVDLIGDGTVADRLWQRFAATVIGINGPSVDKASPAVQGTASALINVRIPPGQDPSDAYKAVTDRLRTAAPWHVKVKF